MFREQGEAITARAFAKARWPQSFLRASSAGPHGRGTLLGAGVSMKAGALLRALVTDGLLTSEPRFVLEDSHTLVHYRLTDKGLHELECAEQRASKYGRPGPRRRTA